MPSDRHKSKSKNKKSYSSSRSRSPSPVRKRHRHHGDGSSSKHAVKEEPKAASSSSRNTELPASYRHSNESKREERRPPVVKEERRPVVKEERQTSSRPADRDHQQRSQIDQHQPRDSRPSDRRGERQSRFEAVRVKAEPKSEDEADGNRRPRAGGRDDNRPSGRDDRRRPDGGGGGNNADPPAEAPAPRDKPDFKLSGKLTEDANIFNGVVVKYSEPIEARKPNKKWRLYSFKGDQQLPMLPIHRQSAYLLGRERRVADIPIDHPSCSKQHAALQFRSLPYKKEDGSSGRRIRPYIIDLESANGTFINNNRIEAKRYVELMEKDVIKFGFSSREYVILHEGSSTVEDDESDAALGDSSPEPA